MAADTGAMAVVALVASLLLNASTLYAYWRERQRCERLERRHWLCTHARGIWTSE